MQMIRNRKYGPEREKSTYSLDVLLQIQVHDDTIQPEHTDQLQQAEELELLGRFRVQEYLRKRNINKMIRFEKEKNYLPEQCSRRGPYSGNQW